MWPRNGGHRIWCRALQVESSRRRGLTNAVVHHCNSAGLVAYYLDVASSPRLLPAKTAAVPHRGWHDEPASGPAMVLAERQFRLGMDVVREAAHWPCVCSTVRT
jgi:hypothetical protein